MTASSEPYSRMGNGAGAGGGTGGQPRRVAVSLMMGIPSPDLAMLAVLAGYDCVILDCEHGFPLVSSAIRPMILAVRAAHGRCIVRLARHDVAQVGMLADIGADGIVLSGPERVPEVTRAASLGAFPGEGRRSVNPFVPAAGAPGDVDRLWAGAAAFEVWAMVETRSFLAELGVLAASGRTALGWTGIIVGPYDLAAALGCAPDPGDQVLLEAVLSGSKAARLLGLRCGLFVRDGDLLRRWRAAGADPDLAVLGYDRDAWFHDCGRRLATVQLRSSADGLPRLWL